MDMEKNTPIKLKPVLIITYSRPENCSKLLDALFKQGCKRVYIAIDHGTTEEILRCQSAFDCFESKYVLMFEKFEVWRRTDNLGVAASVITALDWFFKHEESGLILEDDLFISEDLLKFISNGLDILELDERVFSISGSNFFPHLSKENFLSSYFIGWGWGTWRNRWERARGSYSREIVRPSFSFNEYVNFWNIGAYRCQIGTVDTWDLQLTKYIRENQLVNVISSCNLVSNFGFDEYSSHTRLKKFPMAMPIKNETLDSENFKSLRINYKFDRLLENKVFKIKFRHKFLPIKHFGLHFFKKSKYPPLVETLKRVVLP
jgi:hypothetical protein